MRLVCEQEGESGEEGCCELLTTLQTVLQRACCQREPARCDEPPQQASCSGRPSPFHGSRVPAIPLGAYIQRISRFSKCSNICFVMAYSYMQRLAQVPLCWLQRELACKRVNGCFSRTLVGSMHGQPGLHCCHIPADPL
jgi:hypothetical protein